MLNPPEASPAFVIPPARDMDHAMATCCCTPADCEACPSQFLCNCLQVTEEVVVEAVITLGLRNVRDIREQTGAGGGCTACHARLRQVLDKHAYSGSSSALAMCSVSMKYRW